MNSPFLVCRSVYLRLPPRAVTRLRGGARAALVDWGLLWLACFNSRVIAYHTHPQRALFLATLTRARERSASSLHLGITHLQGNAVFVFVFFGFIHISLSFFGSHASKNKVRYTAGFWRRSCARSCPAPLVALWHGEEDFRVGLQPRRLFGGEMIGSTSCGFPRTTPVWLLSVQGFVLWGFLWKISV